MTGPDRPVSVFTCHRARSGGLLFGLVLAFAMETGALHLLLRTRHPVIAWALTLMSVTAVAWLFGDFRAMGTRALAVTDGSLDLTVGWRVRGRVPLSNVASVIAVGWRELPARSRDYVNATKPTEPNVLLTFRLPTAVRLPGGLRRSVLRLGLCLDEPDRFVAVIGRGAHVN